MKVKQRVEIMVGTFSRVDWTPGIIERVQPSGRCDVRTVDGRLFIDCHSSSMRPAKPTAQTS